MFATLNRPLVTDYVPAAKPPWIFLALVVGILAVAWPGLDLFGSCVLGALSVLFLWVGTRPPPGDVPDEAARTPGDPPAREDDEPNWFRRMRARIPV